MTTRTALVMAGGTGGHIFPGLAIAEVLRGQGWQVHWMGAPHPSMLLPVFAGGAPPRGRACVGGERVWAGPPAQRCGHGPPSAHTKSEGGGVETATRVIFVPFFIY
jgi:hypothetical protein